MKKVFVIIMAVVLLALTITAGCSPATTVQEEVKQDSMEVTEEATEEEIQSETLEAEWSIIIEGGSSGTQEFTSADAAKIDMVEITAVKTKKDGSEVEQIWTGILLSDVLKSLGINDYSLVKVEAPDGYSQEFDAATVNDAGTILGLMLDGTAITEEDGLVQLVVKSMSGSAWIKNIAKISILE